MSQSCRTRPSMDLGGASQGRVREEVCRTSAFLYTLPIRAVAAHPSGHHDGLFILAG